MRDALAHRGPDGAGTWISPDRRVGLGSRRLAIIDLSHSADQPMANEDGSIQLVYNGEIYNHAEVRTELERLGGHTFRTDHSDTEVVVHAYEEWGIDCLHRFRGMFAFALWDGRSRELWLVRDRIGIKPLYYSVHHGRLVFASEIKSLLLDPQQERAVDEESLYHYLSFLCVPAPRTLFRGIRKLEAGLLAPRRRRRAYGGASLVGRVGRRRVARRRLRARDRGARARRAARLGAAAQDQRRARRRVPLGRRRLEHERGAVLRRRLVSGQDVLDRLRPGLSVVSERARVGAADGARGRRRPPRADPLARRPARLPAGDGASPGRARRRPRVLPALLRVGARATGRRDRRAGGRRAPTSSSSATRRGRRCCVSRKPTTCRCRGRSSAAGSRATSRRARDEPAVRVPPSRRGGRAGVLGRRGGVHRGAEAAAALAATATRARRHHLVGRARADPLPLRGGSAGALARELDELPRPAPPPARAAA